MCTVAHVVDECENFFYSSGYSDFKRNYEFFGPYGGFVIASITNINKLQDSLDFFSVTNRPCDHVASVDFDFDKKRIYIRILTILER